MDLANLQSHIRTLASLEDTGDVVISCYLDVTRGRSGYRNFWEERIRVLRSAFVGRDRELFEEPLQQIAEKVEAGFKSHVQGVALFSRAGREPFFLELRFNVPLPNWLTMDATPNIYHLVELKDTYHRFVVMVSTEKQAKIIEVNLGAVTNELLLQRPELRKRIGREWTKEHYQNHRRERNSQFVKQKIKILDSLMSAGGYSHLILAGNAQLINRVRNELPKHLAEKVVDTFTAGASHRLTELVAAATEAFIAQEERESQAITDILQHQVRTGGLAVVGTRSTLDALRDDRVDVLVLSSAYDPEPGWQCGLCGALDVEPIPVSCTECGRTELREVNLKEEMVRLAERCACKVEVVNEKMRFGGIGALVRYRNA